MSWFTNDHSGTIKGIQQHMSHNAKRLGEPTSEDKLHVKKIQDDLVKRINHQRKKNRKLHKLTRIYKIVFKTTKDGWEFDQPKDVAFYRAYVGCGVRDIHFILKHKK